MLGTHFRITFTPVKVSMHQRIDTVEMTPRYLGRIGYWYYLGYYEIEYMVNIRVIPEIDQ